MYHALGSLRGYYDVCIQIRKKSVINKTEKLQPSKEILAAIILSYEVHLWSCLYAVLPPSPPSLKNKLC